MATYKPHNYQKYAEDFLIEHEEAGLFMDMGLGKTVVTLTALSKLSWDIDRVLVIAPKRPAIDTWPEELTKWDHLTGLTWALATGSEKERERALMRGAFITIINRENVVWLVNKYKRKPWPFDCVVIDELSSFKSSKSQRFRALKRVRPFIRRVIGLTGTPASNGYMDLWAECYLLDQGKALGKTLTTYRDIYFTPGRRNGNIIYEWNLRENAKELILDRLKPMCVSMKTEDYLELPDRLDIIRKFELSGKSKKMYQQMEKDLLLEVDDNMIDAVNSAVLTTKLMQICSGAIYDENGDAAYLHDEKFEALDQLIEEANGENVLIFYGFRHERDRLLKRYPEAVDIKDKGAIQAWKAGKIKILLAHPASAGHGLNLQSGGSISIWFSLPMSLELYQQAVKRLHRQGQQNVVRNYILIARDTFEEEVYYRILMNKETRQNAILELLKAKIKKVNDEQMD